MKTASILVNPGVSLHDEALWQIDDVDQTPASSYARDLRVVGQLLERRQITSADLVCVADAYIIRGIQRLTGDSRFRAYFSRRFMTRLHAILHGEFRPSLRSGVIDLRYDLEEIVKLDYLARCKRSKISPLPDPYSLSHILRSAGAYLDGRKNSSLIGISLQDRGLLFVSRPLKDIPKKRSRASNIFTTTGLKCICVAAAKAKRLAATYSATVSWQIEARPDTERIVSRLDVRQFFRSSLFYP